MSSLYVRMQPYEAYLPIDSGRFVPWMAYSPPDRVRAATPIGFSRRVGGGGRCAVRTSGRGSCSPTWTLKPGCGGIIRCGRSGRSRTGPWSRWNGILLRFMRRGWVGPRLRPEKLLRAMLLQAFYSIRSERQLMERIEYDLLFRWFVGLGVDDPAWDHSS